MTARRRARRSELLTIAALAGVSLATPAIAGRLMASANDGKYVLAPDGSYALADPIVPDTLSLIDVSAFPPHIVASVEVNASVVGPPTEVALSPDEAIAVVSATKAVKRPGAPKLADLLELQVVDLATRPLAVVQRLKLPSEPYGIGFNPASTLLGVAHFDGQVSLVAVEGHRLRLLQTLRIASPGARVSQVSFTRDGRFALASLRDEAKVQVLRVDGDRLADTGHFVTAGAQVYTMDVGASWAVVSNVGWTNGDADSVSGIDLRTEPFRTAATVTVPSQPEGLSVSPDGRLLAVGSVNGTNLPDGHPRKQAHGVLGLYRVEGSGTLTLLGQAATGTNTQGVAFTPDGRHVVVQDYMERRLTLFSVEGDRLAETGVWLQMPGHPAALRVAP